MILKGGKLFTWCGRAAWAIAIGTAVIVIGIPVVVVVAHAIGFPL